MSKGYKVVKKWRKLPVYGCSACNFETMNEDAMKLHVRTVHVKRPKNFKPPQPEPMRDRFGCPVSRVSVDYVKKEESDGS
jgi:hypothetical protein